MKRVLEGQRVTDEKAKELAYEYRLVRRFGWSKAQIDEAPGHWSDLMLAIAELEAGSGG